MFLRCLCDLTAIKNAKSTVKECKNFILRLEKVRGRENEYTRKIVFKIQKDLVHVEINSRLKTQADGQEI
jgi:hypothetical protein